MRRQRPKRTINLTQWGSVKSFASNRIAHCNNCWSGDGPEDQVIKRGDKRITLSMGLGVNARTVYLCPDCAAWQAERLESLASDLRRAIAGWIDTNAEWEANRLASISAELSAS